MVNPLVSVIIPVYNAQEYLLETLDAIHNQTYTNLEIICINDGSTDNSGSILNTYKNIKVIEQKNLGQCAALNMGIKEANGEFVKFFDADDYLNPEHIENQVIKLRGEKDAIASSAWGRFYDGNWKSAIFKPENVWKDLSSFEWIVTALMQRESMMGAPLWLIPREVLRRAGKWDERLSLNNDFDFSIRILLSAKEVIFVPDAKLYYRSGQEDNLASSVNRISMESALLTTELGCNSILEFENSTRTRKICANRFKYWMFHFYPKYPDLYQIAKNKCKQLGGSNIEIPAGPKYRLLVRLIGWKLAKIIKTHIKFRFEADYK